MERNVAGGRDHDDVHVVLLALLEGHLEEGLLLVGPYRLAVDVEVLKVVLAEVHVRAGWVVEHRAIALLAEEDDLQLANVAEQGHPFQLLFRLQLVVDGEEDADGLRVLGVLLDDEVGHVASDDDLQRPAARDFLHALHAVGTHDDERAALFVYDLVDGREDTALADNVAA